MAMPIAGGCAAIGNLPLILFANKIMGFITFVDRKRVLDGSELSVSEQPEARR